MGASRRQSQEALWDGSVTCAQGQLGLALLCFGTQSVSLLLLICCRVTIFGVLCLFIYLVFLETELLFVVQAVLNLLCSLAWP